MSILIGTIVVTEDSEVFHVDHNETIQYISQQFGTELTAETIKQFLQTKTEQFDVGGPYTDFDDVIKDVENSIHEDVVGLVQELWNETWEGQSYVIFNTGVEYDRSFVYILDDSKMLVDMES
jgi:hypothetical protein